MHNDAAPLAVVLVNGGSARAVPGTWSATSELLTTELAPRFPRLAFAEVRYRIKTWNELDSCLADARAALDLVDATVAPRRLLDGRSGLDRCRRPPVRRRRARPRAVDSRAALARRPRRQATRRPPRLLGSLSAGHSGRQRRQLEARLRPSAGARHRGHATRSSSEASTEPRSGADQARCCGFRERGRGSRASASALGVLRSRASGASRRRAR